MAGLLDVIYPYEENKKIAFVNAFIVKGKKRTSSWYGFMVWHGIGLFTINFFSYIFLQK